MAEETKKQEEQQEQQEEQVEETKAPEKKEELDVKQTKEYQNMVRLKNKWHDNAKKLEEENNELQERNNKLEDEIETYLQEVSNLQNAMDYHRKRADRIYDTVKYAINSMQGTLNSTISTLNIIDAKSKEDE